MQPDTVVHFHNIFFDILIQLGLIGGALFGAMAWTIASALWRGYRQGTASRELFIFMAGGWAIF
jgi:O-antigen ligase